MCARAIFVRACAGHSCLGTGLLLPFLFETWAALAARGLRRQMHTATQHLQSEAKAAAAGMITKTIKSRDAIHRPCKSSADPEQKVSALAPAVMTGAQHERQEKDLTPFRAGHAQVDTNSINSG